LLASRKTFALDFGLWTELRDSRSPSGCAANRLHNALTVRELGDKMADCRSGNSHATCAAPLCY